MNKFEQAKVQHPHIKESTLKKLYDGDPTETKKYFPFMCDVWSWAKGGYIPDKRNTYRGMFYNVSQVVNVIKEFDNIIDYVEVKDIYSTGYRNYLTLIETIRAAKAMKEEKTFVKEEHVNVLYETDDILLVEPITHRGSMKYGANTRWCTTSKDSPSTFKSYQNGSLCYLINKKNNYENPYNKVAFYMSGNRGSLDLHRGFTIYNTYDNSVDSSDMIKNGWDSDVLLKIFILYQAYIHKQTQICRAQKDIKKFIKFVEDFDSNKIIDNLTVAMGVKNKTVMVDELQSVINQLTKKMKQLTVTFDELEEKK